MKVLVDTCIIIDALQSRQPFSEEAQKIFLLSANKHIDAYITAKAVADIYYLMHRYTHSDAETRTVLQKLFILFDVLDTTSMDCKKALASLMGDYEDAIMVETALRSNMDCIITRNIKDYKKSEINVYSAGEFYEKHIN